MYRAAIQRFVLWHGLNAMFFHVITSLSDMGTNINVPSENSCTVIYLRDALLNLSLAHFSRRDNSESDLYVKFLLRFFEKFEKEKEMLVKRRRV